MGKLAKVWDVSGCTTVDDMLEKSGTNWDPVVSDAGGGYKRVARPDTDTPLSFVGDRYRVNNHRQHLYSLESLIRSGDIIPVSVSVWDNGEVLAYQLRCPNLDVCVHGKDIVSPLLTLAHSYGFKLADSAFFADFRWGCKNQNGIVASLNHDSRVNHRGNNDQRFADVLQRRIGELGSELSDRYSTMRRMSAVPIAGRTLAEYFGVSVGLTTEQVDLALTMPKDGIKGPASKIADILECYEADDCGAPGTVWQAYNAVTRYETHVAGRNDATRQRRMLLGSGAGVVANAWHEASRLAA